MKLKLKSWQIGLIAAAGVVVLGGAGTGIYFGVNHAIDDAVNEKLNAALETTTDATTEPALDEPSTLTPTHPTTESSTEEKECSTTPQTTREPETVLVYVEPTTEVPITWEYDLALSLEVSKLMTEKYPGTTYDKKIHWDGFHPENFINQHTNCPNEKNQKDLFCANVSNADEIVDSWTNFVARRSQFFISVYRYSNGWIIALATFA